MSWHISVLHYFFLFNDILSFGHDTVYESIHQLMVIWAVFIYCLSWITLLWAYMYKLCGYIFSILIHIFLILISFQYLGIKELGHCNCITFWKIFKIFPKVSAPFYIPFLCKEGSNFSISLPTIIIVSVLFLLF